MESWGRGSPLCRGIFRTWKRESETERPGGGKGGEGQEVSVSLFPLATRWKARVGGEEEERSDEVAGPLRCPPCALRDSDGGRAAVRELDTNFFFLILTTQ